jgi:hypothetical protein
MFFILRWVCSTHRHLSIIDCLSFDMCPLLAPLVIVFFSFLFVAVVYSTDEANKAGGTCHKQSIFHLSISMVQHLSQRFKEQNKV